MVPEGWKLDYPTELVSFFSGFAFKSTDSVDAGVRWLKIANVGIGEVKWDDESYLPQHFRECYHRFYLQVGDIVVAMTRPTLGNHLKVAKIKDKDDEALLNQRVAKLVVKKGNDSEFVYQVFRTESIAAKINSALLGTDPPNLSVSVLRDFTIPIPPLPEQKKIAQILSTWDQAIAATEQVLDNSQKRKKALMQQLLTGKKRLPGFDGDWEMHSIGDLLKEVRRAVDWNDDDDFKLLSVKRRSGGVVLREVLKGHQILTKKMKLARSGDFLISKMQVVHGASGLVGDQFDGCHISDSYIALIPRNTQTFAIEFFAWLSKQRSMYHKAFLSSYGVHIEKLTFNFQLYLKEQILIPPTISEQKLIVQVLDTSEQEISALEIRLDRLKEEKKALMQQLLTGKRRVQVETEAV